MYLCESIGREQWSVLEKKMNVNNVIFAALNEEIRSTSHS